MCPLSPTWDKETECEGRVEGCLPSDFFTDSIANNMSTIGERERRLEPEKNRIPYVLNLEKRF